MSVRTSVSKEQLASHRNDIRGIFFRGLPLKSVQKIQVFVKSNTNFRCCNEDLRAFYDNISLNSPPNEKKSHKCGEKNKIYVPRQTSFFSTLVPLTRKLTDNTSSNTIRYKKRIPFVCRVMKTKTHRVIMFLIYCFRSDETLKL